MTSHQKIGFLSISLTHPGPLERNCSIVTISAPITCSDPLPLTPCYVHVQHRGFRLFPQTSLISVIWDPARHHPPASACHPASTACHRFAGQHTDQRPQTELHSLLLRSIPLTATSRPIFIHHASATDAMLPVARHAPLSTTTSLPATRTCGKCRHELFCLTYLSAPIPKLWANLADPRQSQLNKGD